jgi:hypothetical protein
MKSSARHENMDQRALKGKRQRIRRMERKRIIM